MYINRNNLYIPGVVSEMTLYHHQSLSTVCVGMCCVCEFV